MTTNTPVEPPRTAGPPSRRPAPYVRWTFYLLLPCMALLVGIAAGVVYLAWQAAFAPSYAVRVSGVAGEFRRDLAGKLLGAGLPEQAIEQYRLYLAETDLPPERRANMAYTIGKLCMDRGRYEDALTWLYQVEMIDPRTKFGPEAGSKIVSCLEHLGRFAQAQYSLDARSNLDRQGRGEIRGEAVVARIGNDSITLAELDEAMNSLPGWMRDSVKDPAQKEAFLQQYVAEELLYRKAKKLELDKDEQVRRMADQAFRQLLVQKVLESEIREKVNVTSDDVELYFQANRDRYAGKEAFKIRMIQVPAGRIQEARDALDKGEAFSDLAARVSTHGPTRDQGGMIDEWIEEGMDPTGMGNPAGLWEALSSHRQGDLAGPVTSGDSAFLFYVVSRREPVSPSLDDFRDRVRQDLARERMEKAYRELIQQALQASDVKLFPEALAQGTDVKAEGTQSKPQGAKQENARVAP